LPRTLAAILVLLAGCAGCAIPSRAPGAPASASPAPAQSAAAPDPAGACAPLLATKPFGAPSSTHVVVADLAPAASGKGAADQLARRVEAERARA
jgi:hypothetical protein